MVKKSLAWEMKKLQEPSLFIMNAIWICNKIHPIERFHHIIWSIFHGIKSNILYASYSKLHTGVLFLKIMVEIGSTIVYWEGKAGLFKAPSDRSYLDAKGEGSDRSSRFRLSDVVFLIFALRLSFINIKTAASNPSVPPLYTQDVTFLTGSSCLSCIDLT